MTVIVHSNNIGTSVDVAVGGIQTLLYSTTTFHMVRVLFLNIYIFLGSKIQHFSTFGLNQDDHAYKYLLVNNAVFSIPLVQLGLNYAALHKSA